MEAAKRIKATFEAAFGLEFANSFYSKASIVPAMCRVPSAML